MTPKLTKFSELWSALFDGHSLKCEGHTGSYYLFDGDIHLVTHGRSRMLKGFNFRFPTLWSIDEESKSDELCGAVTPWFEMIPEGGIVCSVGWDGWVRRGTIVVYDVIVQRTTAGSFVGATGDHWGYAVPLQLPIQGQPK